MMMIVELEGPFDQLLQLGQQGYVELQGPAVELPDGRHKVAAIVRSQVAVDKIQSLGLTMRVTMDSEEIERRTRADQDMMRSAFPDAGGNGPNGGNGSGTP